MKAKQYALTFPNTVWLPWYQPPRWAAPQPFDVLLLRSGYWVRMVEVRTTQWGVAKASTRQLTTLPGEFYHRQIWRFRPRTQIPDIREWSGTAWVVRTSPWDGID